MVTYTLTQGVKTRVSPPDSVLNLLGVRGHLSLTSLPQVSSSPSASQFSNGIAIYPGVQDPDLGIPVSSSLPSNLIHQQVLWALHIARRAHHLLSR